MDVFEATKQFNETICGLETPKSPVRLPPNRKNWACVALREEVDELIDATTIEEELDALADIIYFAAGRFAEMGVDGSRVFTEVHVSNMRKVRGELSKRPGSAGHDAVKPEEWVPPDYSWLEKGESE